MVHDTSKGGNEKQHNGIEIRTSRTRFANALEDTGLVSPLGSPYRCPLVLDLLTRRIAFLEKDDSSGTALPSKVNVC